MSNYDPPLRTDDPRICKRCRSSWNLPQAFTIYNQRTDTYHSGGSYGVTDCGVDATGGRWLWPL